MRRDGADTRDPESDTRDAGSDTAPDDPFARLLETERIEHNRYLTLLRTLEPMREHFADRRVLDYGASSGLSIAALLRLGAARCVGVEPDRERVERAARLLPAAGLADRAQVRYVEDTRDLQFRDDAFGFILANAVFEHIPQPRDRHLAELWRVLRPGGVLIVNETPNKYFPKEKHTTRLWFNHWLPGDVARRRAIRRGRWSKDRDDWDSSGWRGVGYLELVAPLGPRTLIPEDSRRRHRVLRALGIPASILDPYPTWIFRKE